MEPLCDEMYKKKFAKLFDMQPKPTKKKKLEKDTWVDRFGTAIISYRTVLHKNASGQGVIVVVDLQDAEYRTHSDWWKYCDTKDLILSSL